MRKTIQFKMYIVIMCSVRCAVLIRQIKNFAALLVLLPAQCKLGFLLVEPHAYTHRHYESTSFTFYIQYYIDVIRFVETERMK
jgi:hypothetical protein